jgi:hypothetical protein
VKSTSRIFALPIIGTALALIAFGVVIGVRPSGPAHGVRLAVAVQTTDPDAGDIALRVLKDRIDFSGVGGRFIAAGDKVIVEIGSSDPVVIAGIVERIERRAQPDVNVPAPPSSTAALGAAAPPMKVTKRDPFSRATGFWPRAWPFLAIAGVLLVIAGALWLRSS